MPRLEHPPSCEQILDPSVDISFSAVQENPWECRSFLVIKLDRDLRGGLSCGCIEHVGCNQAQVLNSFLNRNCRIKRCCSAAFSISLSAPLCKRCFNAASISAAFLPVAQTMNV